MRGQSHRQPLPLTIGQTPVDRLIYVQRCRADGTYIVQPFGTYRGYGAFVALPFFRAVAADTDAFCATLGQHCVEALERSGSTGLPVSEAREHYENGLDDISTEVIDAYKLRPPLRPGALHKRFALATIWLRSRQKSWVVTRKTYVKRIGFTDGATSRVRMSRGGDALAEAVVTALAD